MTAARPLHTSSIARPSGVGLEDTSTSARSLHKRSLSFDPDEATLHSPRHEPAGGTPGLQITSRSTAASTGVQGPRSHTAVPVPAPFFTVDRPKGPRDPAGAADGARAPSTASSASEAPEPRRRRPRHSYDRVRPRRDRRSPPRPRRAPRDPHRGRIHPKSHKKRPTAMIPGNDPRKRPRYPLRDHSHVSW